MTLLGSSGESTRSCSRRTLSIRHPPAVVFRSSPDLRICTMNQSLLASFPAYVLQPAESLAPQNRNLPAATGQLTPMVKITALLTCTPIAGAPVVITAPGRYRLMRNLAVSSGTVITIQADDVTLDL